MASEADVERLLQESGSRYLGRSGKHRKYKLPTGQLFIIPCTAGNNGHGWDNALSGLRRELRAQFPHLMSIGSNYTPSKRSDRVSLGDLARVIETPIVVGEQVEFSIEADPLDSMAPLPDTIQYTPPRVHREPPPKPSAVRTLTPRQLQRANAVNVSQGTDAMNAFISKCFAGQEPPVEVNENQAGPENHQHFSPSSEIGDEMHTLLVERAKAEHQAVRKLIEEARSVIDEKTAEIDSLLLKGEKLQIFIETAEMFEIEAANVQSVLPPIHEPVSSPTPSGNVVNIADRLVNRKVIEKEVLPDLGTSEFSPTSLQDTIKNVFPSSNIPTNQTIYGYITHWTHEGLVEKVGRGTYRVVGHRHQAAPVAANG